MIRKSVVFAGAVESVSVVCVVRVVSSVMASVTVTNAVASLPAESVVDANIWPTLVVDAKATGVVLVAPPPVGVVTVMKVVSVSEEAPAVKVVVLVGVTVT